MARVYNALEQGRPTIRTVAQFFIGQVAPNAVPRMQKAALSLADAAEQSGVTNAYHNPLHTLQVLSNAMYLVQLNQQSALDCASHAKHLRDSEIMAVMMGAIGHDLAHDGKTNRDAQDERVPFRLEQMAVTRTHGIMRAAGLPKALCDSVAALIYSTDVGEPNGPKVIARQAIAGGAASQEKIPVQLQPLAKSPRLLAMAHILGDADILSSAGLTVEQLRRESGKLGIELGRSMGAKDSLFFLDRIVGPSFQSAAGKFFNPNLRAIRQEMIQECSAVEMQVPPARVVPSSKGPV